MIDVFLYWLTDFIRFFLDYDFHGVKAIDPVIGGAIVSGVGSLLGGLFGKKSQAKANATNLQIARETNENQYRMFTEGNQFSERMANEAWNRETGYNDPRNVMLRYQRAGINPQVAMSGSLGSAATQPGDMSAPTSLAPPVQHAPTVQPLPHVLSGLEEMSRVVGNLVASGKETAETKRITGLYAGELEQQIEETKRMRLDNAYKYIENHILKKTGLRKALGDLREQSSRIVLNDSMTETEKEKKLNLEQDKFLKEAQKKLTDQQYTQLVETLPLIKKEYQAQITLLGEKAKTEKTQQAANTATANNQNQQAKTEKERTRTEHWNKVAASWNALDAKTRATLNKKYGNIDRFQSIVDKEIDQFVKANSIANPSDIGNKIHSIYDRMLKGIGLENYNAADRKKLGRDLRNYIMDRLYEEYDF